MFKNKVVIITGAASGIGFDIALEFAKNGAKVVLSDINSDALKNAKNTFDNLGYGVLTIKCDASLEKDIKNLIKKTFERYGRIDVFVSNAGFQHVANIENFSTKRYELMLKLMLVGPFVSIKELFPIMKKQKFGRIINMGSINSVIGFAGKAGYNSAKHGLMGLTKVAALEGAKYNITVNSICPGYVDTPLVRNQLKDLAKTRGIDENDALEKILLAKVPQKKLLTTEEIADYTLFIASDKAKSITGQALIIDGGYTCQ